MDETLILCAVDISGRAHLNFDVEMPAAKVLDGDETHKPKSAGLFDSELAEEFYAAFVREAKITLVSATSIVEGGYHDVTLRSTSGTK